MLRGTRVGNAYVALAVDGSSVNDDIAKSVEDGFENVDMPKIAREHGRAYRDTLGENLGGIEADFNRITNRALLRIQKDGKKIFSASSMIDKAMDSDAAIVTSMEAAVEKMFAGGGLQKTLGHIGREAGIDFSGEFGAQLEERLKGVLIGVASDAERIRPGGGADTLVDTRGSAVQGGKEIYLPGPAIKTAVADLRAYNKALERAAAEATRIAERALAEDAKARDAAFADHEKAIKDRAALDDKVEMKRMMDSLARQADEFAASEAAEAAYTKFLEDEERERSRTEQRAADQRRLITEREVRDRSSRIREMTRTWEQGLQIRDVTAVAKNIFDGIRFDPRINTRQIETQFEALRARLLERGDLAMSLSAELDPRDRLRIEGQLAALDRKIRVEIDERTLNDNLLRATRQQEQQMSRSSAKMAAAMGAMFGRGSRVNGLHYFGQSVALATRAVTGLAGVTTRFFRGFSQGVSGAAQGASMLSKLFSGMSGGMRGATGSTMSFAKAGPAAIAAAVGIAVAMSAIVSVAAALATAVGAMLATAVAAATGAVVAFAGALSAAAIAGGLFALAMTSMTNAQSQALKDAFIPAKEVFTGLGQTMLNDLIPAFDQWSRNIQMGAALLQPVASKMGAAFASVGNSITSAFRSDGFQKLAGAMDALLPRITVNLGRAAGAFIDGLSATLAALMPAIDRVASYIARVATQWAKWANTPEGQESILDFINRALEALQSTWNVVTAVGGLIKDVFFSPESLGTGGNLFDMLAGWIEGLREKVKEMAEDGTLQRWFTAAQEAAADFGSLIGSVAGFIAAMVDSGMVGAVADGFSGLGDTINWVSDTFGFLAKVGEGVLYGLQALMGVTLTGFGSVIDGLLAGMQAVASAANKAIDLAKRVPGADFVLGWVPDVASDIQGLRDSVRSNLIDTGFGKLKGAGENFADLFSGRPDAPKDAGKKAGKDYGKAFLDGINSFGSSFDFDSILRGLQVSGNDALNRTDEDKGGYIPKPTTPKAPEYVNPYVDWANSLIKDEPKITNTIRSAMRQMARNINSAMETSLRAVGKTAAVESLDNLAQSIRDKGKGIADAAQAQLNSAATSLANANSEKAAANALRQVMAAQKGVVKAAKAQRQAQRAARLIDKQSRTTARGGRFMDVLDSATPENIDKITRRLTESLRRRNYTVADFAVQREALAERVKEAETALDEAIKVRDDYMKSVTESTRSYAGLLTAEAKTIDGVLQEITAKDITDNLRSRLADINKFQSDLNKLRAMGLSDAAYKQLVDAGVAEGGQYANALLAGGLGFVQQTNSLVAQIDTASAAVGEQASNRLYQAGVDAAQGLLSGLNSISRQLEAAATRLGESIARAIAKSLGIKSPSRVAMALMDDFGDGTEIGLDNQQVKVASAAQRLAAVIPVSPEVARFEAQQAAAAAAGNVSGNPEAGPFRDLHVHTPSENPRTVAAEVFNEVTGGLY